MGSLCGRCKSAQATIHVLSIEPSGEKSERHYCERCAAEENLQPGGSPLPSIEMLEKFVTSAKGGAAPQNLVCEHCEISYLEFRNQGLLGCPHDYDAFKSLLVPLLQRAHDGASRHEGKWPKSQGAPRVAQQEVARLRRMLDEALAAEDYERAAELRDRIREAGKE